MTRSDKSAASDGRETILVEPQPALSPRLVTDPVISVLGAGRLTRALMTTAALTGAKERFVVWARSDRSAELLRIHLADLPRLDVKVVVSASPVVDSQGVIVLAHGARTSRFSRQKSKQALFEQNLAMITQDIAKLEGRVVLVVTNPTASIVAALVQRGIEAYGIGVFNDQLRFELDAPEDLRLVGAHNPFELSYGSLSDIPPTSDYAFSRAQYTALLNRQDRFRLMLNTRGLMGRFAGGIANRAWADIAEVHGATPPARRWYARQRLASRYLENGIAAARATLEAARFFRGAPLEREDVTLEAPLNIAGFDGPVLMGWPFSQKTRLPRRLSFSAGAVEELRQRAKPYHLSGLGLVEAITLNASPDVAVRCTGPGVLTLWGDAFPTLSADAPSSDRVPCHVALLDDPAALAAGVTLEGQPSKRIPQHRGKNPFEHRDLIDHDLGEGRRFIAFETHGGCALVDDRARSIQLAVMDPRKRRDEFRKLLRDQIAVPAWLAAGAASVHAGLLSLGGKTLLLIGGSGAGKTTGALQTLSLRSGGYGSSERVLLFRRGDACLALGVPESLTVFPGSLRGLVAFDDLLQGRDAAQDWMRGAKLRLDRDDTLQRLGVSQMGAPAKIDMILDLHYDGTAKVPASWSTVASPDQCIAAIRENDLTEADDVRASWLNWFQTVRDPDLFKVLTDGRVPMHRIIWREGAALGRLLIALADGGN
jgi:hypothetical protein